MAELKSTAETRPTPDPTVLTTEQSLRGLSALREIIEARLHGTDQIITRMQEQLDTRTASVGEAIKHLQDLQTEKFRGITTQIIERDTSREQTARDVKGAVDAAFAAAKEAVSEQNKSNALSISKSEAAVTKQIDQITITINTMGKGLDDKIDDIKTRLNTIEGHSNGSRDSWGYFVGGLGLLVGVATIVVAILLK